MLRTLHSIPGLIVALLLVVIALTGAALSVFPALERASVRSEALDAATLAGRVRAQVPGVETIVRRPSGTIVAYHLEGDEQRASIIDPSTGKAVGPWQPSAPHRWLRNFHRKLLLSSDAGRIAVGVMAGALLFILITGVLLLAHRMGGWSQILGRIRGNTLQRLHDETARVALAGLMLSAATAILMSLSTFGLLPEEGGAEPFFDPQPSGASAMALERMAALRSIDVSELRQLKLASPDDPSDVIELDTTAGTGMVDAGTGQWLLWQPFDGWQRLNATVQMLHTGEGLWWLGLLLGAASLTVPLLATTGLLLWIQRRRSRPRLAGNVPLGDADTLLLVGSESNMTWGFAIALHDALVKAGVRVHTAPMNDRVALTAARRVLILTSTYGDGEAPESARHFLDRLAFGPGTAAVSFAVLGFGDRQFPHFCGYAVRVHETLCTQGLKALGPPGMVDRQSEPEFLQWCEWLGNTLNLALEVRYHPMLPPTTGIQLVSRTDYGTDPQTRTSVLRFRPAASVAGSGRRSWGRSRARRLERFDTGDLLGVVPPGAAAPRYYSLASAASEEVVEICVRRHPGGLCSRWLTDLEPGATVDAFIRPHEKFRPAPGDTPVILIGAGTGIGPLVGFIRHNPPARPMYLYFGTRSAEDGYLYADELQQLASQGRLHALSTAFSRATPRAYVQDRLLADAQRLRQLISQGAQVMVCGGRKMAEGVAQAWDRILAETQLSVAKLRAEGRYVEDVY